MDAPRCCLRALFLAAFLGGFRGDLRAPGLFAQEPNALPSPQVVESLWQAEAQVLPAPEPDVRSLRFSEEGTWLIVGHGQINTPGRVRLWNLPEQREVGLWHDQRGIASVAISAKGRVIAAAGWSHRVWIRSLDDLSREIEIAAGPRVVRLAFSPDGTMLATASEGGQLTLWNATNGQKIRQFGETFPFHTVAFSPVGPFLAAGGGFLEGDQLGRIGLWSLTTGDLLREYEGHDRTVTALAFTPDGLRLLSGGMDSTIWLFDVESGGGLQTWTTPQETITDVACAPEGSEFAATSYDGLLRMWDLASGGELATVSPGPEALFSVAYRPVEQGLSESLQKSGVPERGSDEAESPLPAAGTVAVSGQSGAVQFYDRLDRREAVGLQAGDVAPQPVRAIACSPDGQWLATAGEAGTIHLRDPQTGRVRGILAGHQDEVLALAFRGDSQQLASAGLGGPIRIWHLATGKLEVELPGHATGTYALAFAPDGRLASGGYDRQIFLWELSSPIPVAQWTGHEGAVRSLAFFRDGQRLASASSDQTLGLWDVKTGTRLVTGSGHRDIVRCVAIRPDQQQIATADEAGVIRLWNAEGTFQRELAGHTGMVWALAYSPRGPWLASGGLDQQIRLWESNSGAAGPLLAGATDVVTSLAFTRSADLIGGSLDRQLRRYAARGLAIQPTKTLQADAEAVRFAAMLADGQTLISAGHDRVVKFWNWSDQSLTDSLKGHTGGITCGDLSADQTQLATGSWDGTIRLWNVPEKRLAGLLREHRAELGGVQFSPDGTELASCGHDGSFRIWDLKKQQPVWRSRRETLPGRGVAWSPDKKWLIGVTGDYRTPSRPGQAILWNVGSQQEVARLKTFGAEVKSVQFSPTGQHVLIASNDKTVRLYQMPDLQEVQRLLHDRGAFCGIFLGDDQTVATMDFQGQLQIWEALAGRRLAVLEGHSKWSVSMQYLPARQELITTSADGTVRSWSLREILGPGK